jgi:hypothetical protein
LVEATCGQLGALFDLAYRRGRVGRVDSWDVETAIAEGVRAGHLERRGIHKDWLKKLGLA